MMLLKGLQKIQQNFCCFLRVQVRKKMAAGKGAGLHIRKPVFPCLGDIVFPCHRAIYPIENKRRAGDLAAEICSVMGKVILDRGTVIIAH